MDQQPRPPADTASSATLSQTTTPPSEATSNPADVQDSNLAIRARLEQIKAYRGRVMPNHAVLAIEFPELLDKYEAVYAETTLGSRALRMQDKKFILLQVVCGMQTPLGSYHVKDYLAAGGTEQQVKAALRLAMLVMGSALLDDVAPGWNRFVADLDYEAFFNDLLIAPALDAGIPCGIVELAMANGHACRRGWSKVGFHLKRARQMGISDRQMAEALTTLILTAGNPIFVQACGVWQQLVAEGAMPAGELHRYAADLARK